MFGDLILKIKEKWKQFWCIHDYKPSFHLEFRWRQCAKCGGMKNKNEKVNDYMNKYSDHHCIFEQGSRSEPFPCFFAHKH